ncbi:MAG: hypothetical protein ACLSB9_35765 [Hydrogeniiclostridium mannosilyticum]
MKGRNTARLACAFQADVRHLAGQALRLRPRNERHRRNECAEPGSKKFFDANGAAYPVWQALEAEAGRYLQ